MSSSPEAVRGARLAAALLAASAALLAPAVARDLSSAPVPCVVVRADGTCVLAQGESVVEVGRDGSEVRRRSVPRLERVESLAASPDGKRLAVGGGIAGRTGEVALLDALSLEPLHATEDPLFGDLVTALAWSPDGEILAAGAGDRRAILLGGNDLATRAELLGHTGPVVAVDVSGELVATGSLDRTVRIWSRKTGAEERQLTQHADAVTAVRFLEGGSRLASASLDRTVRLWDPRIGRLVRTVREHAGKVLALVPAGGLHVWSGATDGIVRRVDLEEGRVASERFGAEGRWVLALARSPEGGLVLGLDRGSIRIAVAEGPPRR